MKPSSTFLLKSLTFKLSALFLLFSGLANSSNTNTLRGNGIQFIENKGQVTDMNHQLRPDILYVGDGGNAKIYLRKNGISYVTTKKENENTQEEFSINEEASTFLYNRIDLDFVDCNLNPTILKNDQTEGYSNYYLGHCSGGITNVHSYNKIIYENIYNNIDVAYYGGKAKGLKYDLIVKPGGNPNNIKMQYSGADEIKIEESRLKIKTYLGTVVEYMPKVYQNINGKIIDVPAKYKLQGTILSFELAEFQKDYPLIIDPLISYFGGSNPEVSDGITTDKNGNFIVIGSTMSANFPVTAGAYQATYAGGTYPGDAFISKFDLSGNLLWSTYYGGTLNENVTDLVADGMNSIFITGYTFSSNFPVSATAFQPTFMGGVLDAFIIKLDASGALVWSSFYGSTAVDYASGIAVDANNDIAITGTTTSGSLTTTAGCFQNAYGGGSYDAFVAKFGSNGNRIWSTFYGGSVLDMGNSIAADAANNIIVTGQTTSANFPVSPGSIQTIYAGGGSAQGDAFILKFNSNGTRIWATFLGGSDDDMGVDIATDSQNDIVVTGMAKSMNFPVTPGCYRPVHLGFSFDIFISKITPAGTLTWSTYLGSPYWDGSPNCAIDNRDNIYVLWEAEDINPGLIFSCGYQKTFAGGPSWGPEDQIISKFSSKGDNICGTYLGGPDEDDIDVHMGGIACYGGNIFITALTLGTAYPVTSGAYQTVYGGGSGDMVIAKLCGLNCGDTTTFNNFNITSTQTNSTCNNISANFNQNYNPCDTTSIIYQWSFTGATTPSSSDKNPTNVIYPAAGTYPVTLTIFTDCDTVVNSTIVTLTITPTITSISSNTTICSGDTTTLSVIGAASFTWTPASGLNSSTNASILASPNTTTTYTVNGLALNGCNYSLSVTVFVNPTPLINISGDSTVCFGTNTTLSASGGINYTWNTGTNSSNMQITPSTNTMYAVVGTDINGCRNNDSILVVVNTLPIANAGPDVSVCSGSSASITASGGIFYSWSPATGVNNINIFNPIINTTTSTSYSLTVTDANGCTANDVVSITVNTLPMANAGNNTAICNGSSTLLNASGGIIYLWTPSTGLSNNFIYNPIASPTSTTNYSVTVTDVNGCTASNNVVITVNPLPIANAGTDDTICKGTNTLLQATGGINYSWSPAGSLSSALINNPIAFPLTTTTYTVIVTDVNGCTSADDMTLTIINPPTVNAGSDISTCFGTSVWLSASGASAYSWSPSTGLNTTNIFNPVSNATTSISYVVTGFSYGCSNTDTVNVIVNALPEVYFTSDDTSACESACINFNNTSPGAVSSLWTFGNGNISHTPATSNCFLNPGSYNVSLTITDVNGCSNTLTKPSLIKIFPKPVANFTTTPSIATINSTINFLDLSANANKWQWSFGDNNNSSSSLQNPSYSYADSGVYAIKLIASNEFGCSDTAYHILRIEPEFSIYVPNTFTPNEDGLNDFFYPVLSLKPAEYDLWIYDRWGNQIWKTEQWNKGWDGTANGGKYVAQQDVYIWKVVVKDFYGIKHSFIGSITLIK